MLVSVEVVGRARENRPRRCPIGATQARQAGSEIAEDRGRIQQRWLRHLPELSPHGSKAEERARPLERVLGLCQLTTLERAGERVRDDRSERGGALGRRRYARRNRDESADHRHAGRKDRLHFSI
jgi:hypothetical protein